MHLLSYIITGKYLSRVETHFADGCAPYTVDNVELYDLILNNGLFDRKHHFRANGAERGKIHANIHLPAADQLPHNQFFLLKNHIMVKTMVTMTLQIIKYPQCQRNSGM